MVLQARSSTALSSPPSPASNSLPSCSAKATLAFRRPTPPRASSAPSMKLSPIPPSISSSSPRPAKPTSISPLGRFRQASMPSSTSPSPQPQKSARARLPVQSPQPHLLAPFSGNRRWDGDFPHPPQASLRRHPRPRRRDRLPLRPLPPSPAPQHPKGGRRRASPPASSTDSLGPHLVDQALTLFGPPARITASIRHDRDRTDIDDAFDLDLDYDMPYGRALRYSCHATMLAADPSARFLVHGTHGSFRKFGVDPQEPTLLANDQSPPALMRSAATSPGSRGNQKSGLGHRHPSRSISRNPRSSPTPASPPSPATTASSTPTCATPSSGKPRSPFQPKTATYALLRLLDLARESHSAAPNPPRHLRLTTPVAKARENQAFAPPVTCNRCPRPINLAIVALERRGGAVRELCSANAPHARPSHAYSMQLPASPLAARAQQQPPEDPEDDKQLGLWLDQGLSAGLWTDKSLEVEFHERPDEGALEPLRVFQVQAGMAFRPRPWPAVLPSYRYQRFPASATEYEKNRILLNITVSRPSAWILAAQPAHAHRRPLPDNRVASARIRFRPGLDYVLPIPTPRPLVLVIASNEFFLGSVE